ncbi:hypothetical protein TWF694_001004 [Orbilia ellipsospora]|uniref:Uncharacterized protein n=1 Tax=Orbilia ellipsospora TaxID=2528407 RepID=A0AAV9XSZ2_9PEZI
MGTHHQRELLGIWSRVIQQKKTNYTSLLFILSVTLSIYFASPPLKAPDFSKGFGLLPLVRADDRDLSTPYARIDKNQLTQSPRIARSRFHLGGSASLYCYPSVGGHWYATDVSSVELDFLGIDRFKPQDRSFNQTEEDAFCERFQLLEPFYDDEKFAWHIQNLPKAESKRPSIRHIFCWPRTGGAWVKKLMYTREGGWYSFGPVKVDSEGEENLVGAIWNAHSMEERCQAFERAEGKFCAKLEDCEETKPYMGIKIWLDD